MFAIALARTTRSVVHACGGGVEKSFTIQEVTTIPCTNQLYGYSVHSRSSKLPENHNTSTHSQYAGETAV